MQVNKIIGTRGKTALGNEVYWGIDTQPQRLSTVIKYSKNDDHILDLGSGRGAYTNMLSQKGFSVIGSDINLYPEWISAGNNKFVVGSGRKLPFCDKTFDTTIAFEVLEHIDEPVEALQEIARCTKKQFIFSVPNCDLNNKLRRHDLAMAHWTDPTHINFFTKNSLVTFLTSNGFEIIEMIDCYRISPNDYYWDAIRLPRIIRNSFKIIFGTLNITETYWSSILIVANILI